MTEALIKLKVDGAAAARNDVNGVTDALKGIGGITATGLAALGVSLSAVSFAKMVMGSIESTAALKDLAIQTGSSAQALGEFRKLGAYTETSIDNIAGAMNKLAKNMSMSDESSKATGQAIRALGLDFNTLKSQSPDEQLITIAKSLDQFEDGAGKSAAAMSLFGKEGAKLLPFLKDLADESENVTNKLSEQEKATKANLASMADNFSDNLQKMSKESQSWKKEIADGILPVLDETAQAWIDVSTGPNGFKAEIKKLASDGTLADWARTAVTAVTYVMDVFSGLKAVVKSVGSYIGSFVASIVEGFSSVGEVISKLLKGDFDGATKSFASAIEKQRAIDEGLREDLDKTWGSETLGSKIRSRIAEIQTVGVASKEVKKALKFTANEDNSANIASINKEASAYANWTAQVKERIEQYKLELAGEGKVGEARKLQIKLDQELKSGKLQLTAAHEKTLRENIEAAISEEKKVETMKSVAEAQRKLTEERDREYKSIADEAAKNEELVRTFGMTKAAIEEVELARMQERLAQKESLQLDDAEVKQLERLIDAKKRNAEAISSLESLNAAQKQLDDLAAESRRFYEDLYRGLSDSLYRGFEAGKGFFQSFWDGIKNLFKTTVLKLAVQGVMTSVLGGVAGTAGAATGASQLGNLSTMYSAGKTMWEGFSAAGTIGGGITAIGNALGSSTISAFGTGMGLSSSSASAAAAAYSNAGMASTGSAISAGSSVGAAVPIVGWILAGMAANNSLYDKGWKYNTGADGTTKAAGLLAGGLPLMGGLLQKVFGISDKTASMLTGSALLTRLFGHKEAAIQQSDFSGTFSDDGFSGTTRNVYKAAGGLFRSDKWSETKTAIGADQSKALSETFAAIKEAAAGYAGQLGLSTDALNGFTKSFSVNLSITGDAAKDAEANRKIIENIVSGISDEISLKLMPSLKDFSLENESASATLARISLNFSTLNEIFGALKLKLFDLGNAGISASLSFTELMGGLDSLKSFSASYYENFFTQSEKNAAVMASITDELKKQNLVVPETRAGYRALVEEISKTGTQEQLAALLKLNNAFASVVPAADEVQNKVSELDDRLSKFTAATDAAASPVVRLSDAVEKVNAAADNSAAILSERQSLQDQLDELTLTSAELLKKKRDALYAENRELFDSVQAAIAAKDASEKLAKANEAAAASYKKASDTILQNSKDFAANQANTLNSVMDSALSGMRATEKALKDLAENMKQARDSLVTGSQSGFSVDERLSILKQQLATASQADTPALANSYLSLLKESGIGQVEYQREFASMVNKLDAYAMDAQAKSETAYDPSSLSGFFNEIQSQQAQASLKNAFNQEYAFYADTLKASTSGPNAAFSQQQIEWGNKLTKLDDALRTPGVADELLAKLLEEIKLTREASVKTSSLLNDMSAGGGAMLVEIA